MSHSPVFSSFPQQSSPLFTLPTLPCAQFVDLPWWSRPGDSCSPENLLSSGVLTRSSLYPSPGSTCLRSRSPRSPWGGCTSARPQPTTCGRKANPTQTRGEEHRRLLQVVLSTQGLRMCQSPGWVVGLEGGGHGGQVLNWLFLSLWRKGGVCCGHKKVLPNSVRGWGQCLCPTAQGEGTCQAHRDSFGALADWAVPRAGWHPDLSPLSAGISCSWWLCRRTRRTRTTRWQPTSLSASSSE